MARQTPGMNRVNVSSRYFIYFYLLNSISVQNEYTSQGTLIWYRRKMVLTHI